MVHLLADISILTEENDQDEITHDGKKAVKKQSLLSKAAFISLDEFISDSLSTKALSYKVFTKRNDLYLIICVFRI